MTDLSRYRPCAGIMLLNPDRHIFVGQRMDNAVDAWQMPQGGIDPGEDAQTAALRELTEETGIAAHLVEILAQSAGEHLYDLPAHYKGKFWGGRYDGQRQTWFVMRFLGSDADVDIATVHQEFRAWRWSAPHTLVDLIVPFKKELYANVLAEFANHL
jgi:putative (di)nucleoside polyphosphate hydrolase